MLHSVTLWERGYVNLTDESCKTTGGVSVSPYTVPSQKQSNLKSLGRGYTMEESLHPQKIIKGVELSAAKSETQIFHIHRQ